MKLGFFFSTLIAVAAITSGLQAQHAGDIELGYNSLTTPTVLEIHGGETTSDGFRFFEAEMEELDPFTPGDFSSDEPGFTANPGEGLLVNPGDQIWINTLDASLHSAFGVGYLNYYNPVTDALEASGRIAVLDNSAGTADLILNGGSIESGVNPQFIDAGDGSGDIHDHLVFDLLDDATAPTGAYGIMFQLQSDFATADGTMDLTSESFWIVWNHGMSEADFENNAVPKFGITAIPEPGSAAVLIFGLPMLAALRRRKAS